MLKSWAEISYDRGPKTFAALSVRPKNLAASPPRPAARVVHLDEPDASSN
jgi:hypothetical protein